MLRYVFARLLTAVPVLLIVAVLTFTMFQLLPGGVAEAILGENAMPSAVAQLNEALGLNRPPIERFFDWIGGFLHGDMGESLARPYTVFEAIKSRLPVSGLLVLYGIIGGLIIGIPVGVFAGAYPAKWWSQGLMGFAAGSISVPRFFIAAVFVLIFAVKFRWFAATGYVPISDGIGQHFRSLTLPALSLAIPQAAHFARVIRASITTAMESEYIRYARSKGYKSSRVLWRHAVPNSLTATIMTVAFSIGTLISGALVIEVVFALPGLGTLMYQAVQDRDVPVLQGVILTISLVYVLSTLLGDLVHAAMDPRIRRQAL